MKNFTQPLKVIILSLMFSFGIGFVYAWTGPITTPPSGNTSAPINTSTDSQYKNGALGVGGLLKGYGGIIGLSDAGNNSLSQWLGQLGSAGSGVGINSGFVGMEFETIKDGSTAGGPEQKLHFLTHRNGVQNQRALTIDGVGNIGIGNTLPSQKLDIAGNAQISGDLINKSYKFVFSPIITYGGYGANSICCGGGAGYNDTCNGDYFNAYTCSGIPKTCIDVVSVADYWSCGYCGKVTYNYRNVDCGTTASVSANIQ